MLPVAFNISPSPLLSTCASFYQTPSLPPSLPLTFSLPPSSFFSQPSQQGTDGPPGRAMRPFPSESSRAHPGAVLA